MGDKFDLDKLEFEDISDEPRNDISSQEEAVSFSVKIIDVLDAKMRNHNADSSNKVTLRDLREVYSRGAEKCHQSNNEEENCGLWALARVNMFLRFKSGEKMNNSASLANNQSFDDISDNWFPSEEDFENASKEMKELSLEYNFSSAEELYLDNYQRIDWEW